MPAAPLPANESERHRRVQELCLTELAPDEGFDSIVAVTAEYFQAPVALISIVDGQRQWFRASVGIDFRETPRRDAFCGYALLGRDVLEVPDASQDERFRDFAMVTGPLGVRFYAGMPLVTSDDLALGSLCVIDTKPRPPMTQRDRNMLRLLAELVMVRIASLRDRHYIDEPTGLFNRLRMEKDVALALESGQELTVVAADMLSPRFINDIINALGYPFFNEAMLMIQSHMQALLPYDTILYKISPTRFGFLLRSACGGQNEMLYQRILQAFKAPIACQGIPIQAELGLGVLRLHANQRADPKRDWLRLVVSAADDARTHALGWTAVRPATDKSQQRAFLLLTELCRAVDTDDALWLEYQPVIDLASGRCEAVESLLRWRHPTLGRVEPGEFIPLAERTSLIRPLSRWVLRRAIKQVGVWRRQGLAIKVAINVSAHDLEDSLYIDLMFQLLDEHGVNPRDLKLEFTESALTRDAQEAARLLARVAEAGVTVSIDDFGTGYSNWAYLRQLPAKVIKVDQAFIRPLPGSERDRRLAQSIIELAQGMGYRVVAEGIESRDTMDLLRQWGCEQGQGYFIARPMTAKALVRWLRNPPEFNAEVSF